ncbi:MAG: cysteine desulfurase family protein [Myxococcota bacterium]
MRIYLDHNATTPLRPEVVSAMERVLRGVHGNPSSVHAEGSAAKAEIDRARRRVASLLGCDPGDVLFTGSATEANNTALLRIARRRASRGQHLVTTTVEHPSVEASLCVLERDGWKVTRVPVDGDGRVDPEEVADAIRPETALVSAIWANNETGVLQPIDEVAVIARECGVLVHSDATQAVGKVPVDLRRVPLNLLSLSAHKFNGPKGVGCLVVRGDLAFEPLLCGGPQEGRRRGGTENVAGIAGLGEACALAERELTERMAEYGRLRDRLWEGIVDVIPRVHRNGSAVHGLPNTLNVEFEGAAGELLLQALDLEGVAVSAGAACASGSIEPSPVLMAMGRTPEAARGSLRLSVGLGVDDGAIDRVLGLLPDLVERARHAGDV